MAEDRPLFVARPEDVESLKNLWADAREGKPKLARLTAEFGGGRRAVVQEFLRGVADADEDVLVWRAAATDQENGLQWLMRMWGSLVAQITGDVLRRGKVEMILNARLPSQTKRVQNWYQQFVAGLKETKADPKTGQMQLRVPQDNPLLALVEIANGIAHKLPIILEIQGANTAHTILLAQFVEALYCEATETKSNILLIIHDEPDSDLTKSSNPAALVDMFDRRDDVANIAIAPWGAAETKLLLESRGVEANPERLAEIAQGRPGFILELVDILQERDELGSDLAGVSLATLVPMAVDDSDLDIPDAPPEEGKRTHAKPEDAARVAHLAALLGHVFPSSLVADMGGFERESVDDLIDAMGDLFDEVQFSEQMGTWIYRFKRGSWREGILEQNDTEDGHRIARNVGVFMERFLVPRGFGFMVKTCRLYAEHGAFQRASAMRAITLSNDSPDVWGMSYDLMRYYDEVPWTDQIRRTVYTTLLDHLVNSGNVQGAEKVHGEVTEWASEKEDRELQGWLLFNGSKLDARRQDFYRARDRANDALTIFSAIDHKPRLAEIYGHLAGVELADGNPDKALENVEQAMTHGTREDEEGKKIVLPAVLAQSEMIRGVIARRANDLDKAIDHFRRANEVAGNTGLGPQALDAGLQLGEALFAKRDMEKARDVLRRLVTACRQVGSLPRERAAAEMLAQAEGAARNFEGALQLAQRVLQISQQLKIEHALPVDLYNVGFFHLTMNKGTEALPFFNQAQQRLKGNENHPILKDLYYYSGIANLQAGHLDQARDSLRRSIRPLQAAKDVRKVVSAMDQLAAIEHRGGNADGARKLLGDALTLAQNNNLKEERKVLKKRLESL